MSPNTKHLQGMEIFLLVWYLLTQIEVQGHVVPQPSNSVPGVGDGEAETASLLAVQNRRESEVAFTKYRALLLMRSIEIQYMFSKAPIGQILLLGDLLSKALQSSHHWAMERRLRELTTDCVTTMIPKDRSQDVSITLWVGPEAGLLLNDMFSLRKTWSSSHGHLSL